jgi:hypothetical protein
MGRGKAESGKFLRRNPAGEPPALFGSFRLDF